MVDRDPTDGVGPESEEISRLLNPGMSFSRCIDAQVLRPRISESHLAYVPIRSIRPGGKKPDKVRHVSTADEQSINAWVPDQLCDPPDRLGLDLGCHWRQRPRANVRVGCGCKQIAEDADWSRRRRDIAPEPRMAVKQGMVK